MGKYDPLRDYLKRCGKDEVILSFADIESIIGRPLPPSAGSYDAWWGNIGGNPFTQHSHARSWHSAGYRAQANRAAKTVRFYRQSDRQHIVFPLLRIRQGERRLGLHPFRKVRKHIEVKPGSSELGLMPPRAA